jgi:hypothetical protein
MAEFRIAHILVHKILQKKTLVSAQNPENKGSTFFLPARSMVLKVVTGKILETLELWRSSERPEAATVGRLSKTKDYLADNFCVFILSYLLDWVQEQSD